MPSILFDLYFTQHCLLSYSLLTSLLLEINSCWIIPFKCFIILSYCDLLLNGFLNAMVLEPEFGKVIQLNGNVSLYSLIYFTYKVSSFFLAKFTDILLIILHYTFYIVLLIPYYIIKVSVKLLFYPLYTILKVFSVFSAILVQCFGLFVILANKLYNFFKVFHFCFLMFPELVLLGSACLSLLLFASSRYKYNNEYYYEELIRAFGYNQITKLFRFGTLRYSMLMRFHYNKRRLTSIILAWRVTIVGCLISLFWFFKYFEDSYTISVVENFDNLSTLCSTSHILGYNDKLFGMHFYHDGFTFSSRFFITFVAFLFFILVRNELFYEPRLNKIEFLSLYLFGTVFSMTMISSSSLLTFFLSAEGLVMSMYILTAGCAVSSFFPVSNIFRFRSVEGALKYSFLNAISTTFILLGVLLLFLFSFGKLFFIDISMFINKLLEYNTQLTWSVVFNLFGLFVACMLICLAFFFKLGIAPFHNWIADFYESTITINLAYFLLIPKAAVMLTFINFYRFFFINFNVAFTVIFLIIGLMSTFVGSLLAINQSKISRTLAYSSVAYSGIFIVLLSISFLPTVRLSHLPVVFVVSYIIVLLFFISIYLALRYSPFYFSYSYVKQFRLAHFFPKSFQIFLANSIFSLAGIPPLLGWVLKFLLVLVFVKFFSTILNEFSNSITVPIDLAMDFFHRFDSAAAINEQQLLQKGFEEFYLQPTLLETLTNFYKSMLKPSYRYTSLYTRQLNRIFYTEGPMVDLVKKDMLDPLLTFVSKDTIVDLRRGLLFTAYDKGWVSAAYDKSCSFITYTHAYLYTKLKFFLIQLFFPVTPLIVVPLINAGFDDFLRVTLFSDWSLLFKTNLYLNTSWVYIFFIFLFFIFLLMSMSTYYYIRILKSIYTETKHAFVYYDQNRGDINISLSLCFVVVFLSLLNVLCVVYFQEFNNLIFLLFCFNSIGF